MFVWLHHIRFDIVNFDIATQRRIESVEDRKKKEAVIAKLAEKLGDAEYWTKYLEGIP